MTYRTLMRVAECPRNEGSYIHMVPFKNLEVEDAVKAGMHNL